MTESASSADDLLQPTPGTSSTSRIEAGEVHVIPAAIAPEEVADSVAIQPIELDDEEVIIPPRQKLFNPLSWALVLSLVAGGGFLAGAKVQKSRTPATVSTATGGAQGQGGRGQAAQTAGAAASGQPAQPGGAAPAAGQTATGQAPNGQAQAGGGQGQGQGGGTTGTVKLVDGKHIYIADQTGSIIKVTPAADATITVTKTGTAADFKPGDTVSVRGTADAEGTIQATSVSSGAGGGRGTRGTSTSTTTG